MKLTKIFFINLLCYCILFNNTAAWGFNKIITGRSVSTRYFVLDLKSTPYKVTSVKLNAAQIIGKSAEIDIFNIFLNPNVFVTFSVLPEKLQDNWMPIDIDSVKKGIVDGKFLLSIFQKSLNEIKSSGTDNYDRLKRENDIKIIIKQGNKYEVSIYCITEFFRIITREVMFPDLMTPIDINIKSPVFTAKDYEEQYKKINNAYSVNAITSTQAVGATFFTSPFEKSRLFFSGICSVGSIKGYKFWQFTTWPVTIGHGLNAQRGVDRFIYVPGFGIIAGSYDFWFKQYVSNDKLFDNYLNETVIMPESINGKKTDVF